MDEVALVTFPRAMVWKELVEVVVAVAVGVVVAPSDDS